MTLKLYVDMLSQPCRALVMFMNMSNISCKFVPIAIRKGEHKTDDFLKLNPLGKVPVLQDDDFTLTESVAIFQYLCRKHAVPDNIYPADLKRRAKIDEYLNWQHLNTRSMSASVFLSEVMLFGNLEKNLARANVMLDEFERMFLNSNSFIGGEREVSFADVLAVCELMQPEMSGRKFLEGRPRVEEYVERVKRACQPHFDHAHQTFFKVRSNLMRRKAANL